MELNVHHPPSFNSSVPDLNTDGQWVERTPDTVLIQEAVCLRCGSTLAQFELRKAPISLA